MVQIFSDSKNINSTCHAYDYCTLEDPYAIVIVASIDEGAMIVDDT